MKTDEKKPQESTRNRPRSWIEQEIINALASLKTSFEEGKIRQLNFEKELQIQEEKIHSLEQRLKSMEAEMASMTPELASACETLKKLANELMNGSN